jgi:Protein of unknown function (DUF3096)
LRRSAAAPHGRNSRRRRSREQLKGNHVNINLSLTPIISLLAGILILVMPKLLNFIVAIYLIAIGLIGLLGAGSMHLR